MDSKRCMISTKFLQFLKQLMPIIGSKRINGKNNTGKSTKEGRKHIQTVSELIKKKMQTHKKKKKLKKKKGGGRCPPKLNKNIYFLKTLHQFYNAAILDLIFVLYDIAVNFKKNKKQRRFKK